ncbi:MAG: small multi-drug export protein [Armatimonadota bacterium]|nr:small multi-drug export protein [Armatimonadota bacterium]
MTELPGSLEAARQWLVALSPAQQAIGLALLTAVPWIELRGSIPLAVALGWSPLSAALVGIAANCLVVVPCYYFMQLFYDRWLSRVTLIRRAVERVRVKGAGMVERYELLGLTLFVAVPLPGTGAYAGTTLAWLLGRRRWRAMGAVAVGVVLAGIAVTLLTSGAAVALRRFFE